MTSWCPPWRRLSPRRKFARKAMKFPRLDRAHLTRPQTSSVFPSVPTTAARSGRS
jgi:hypothetical protein